MTEDDPGPVIRSAAARGLGHVMPRSGQPPEVPARGPGLIQDVERIQVIFFTLCRNWF